MPGDSLNINNKATAQNTYDAIVIGPESVVAGQQKN